MWQDELMVSESVKACLDNVYSSIAHPLGGKYLINLGWLQGI